MYQLERNLRDTNYNTIFDIRYAYKLHFNLKC